MKTSCHKAKNVNPLTPRDLCKKHIFWTFWRFSGWSIYSKRHLQHDSMPFFPLATCFMTFLLRQAQESKFWDFGQGSDLHHYAFVLFFFSTFFFAFSFSPSLILLQWLAFYWAHFLFKHLQESMIKKGNFCHGVTMCIICQEILLRVFHSNFWAFLCIYQGQLTRSFWSWYHWKDLHQAANLIIDDANWVKGDDIRSGTKAMGVNGLMKCLLLSCTINIPFLIAFSSSIFHSSATSLAKGSSGLGALSSAWIDNRTVRIWRAGLHLSVVRL